MRITLEPDDLQAIADAVVRKLSPLLVKVQEAAERPKSIAARTVPIVMQEAPRTTRAVGDVIRRKDLCQITGLSMTTLWRQEREGFFPARIRLTDHSVGWRRSEDEAWLATRQAV
ncbi:MAG TPA: AlpA family phage regulatory protein [Desulfuromonadales bacterium]|nr:AlpA family phage regulatory protein [Desulfuromonadales bacterium]